jgi:hypothetical protein
MAGRLGYEGQNSALELPMSLHTRMQHTQRQRCITSSLTKGDRVQKEKKTIDKMCLLIVQLVFPEN